MNEVDGVVRCRVNWSGAYADIWYEAGNEPKEADIRDAVKRANFTPGERVK